MRVHADNTIIVQQGQTKEVDVDMAAARSSSGHCPLQVVDLQNNATGISISPQEWGSDGMDNYPIKVEIIVPSNAEMGEYRIQYNSRVDYEWHDTGYSITVVSAEQSSSGTPQAGNSQPDEVTIKVVEESPAPIYIPKTPEEIYRDELALCYPHGYAFVKAGNKELLQTSSKDGMISSVYYAGTKLGSFSVKAADGTIKKLHIYDTIVAVDGRVYLQVWVNTNDGQAISLDLTDADRAALKESGISGVYVNKTAMDL